MSRSAIEGIMRGPADARAGRVVPHDMAMAELDAAIEAIVFGYEAMAADAEREQSAREWCEALVGDGARRSKQT